MDYRKNLEELLAEYEISDYRWLTPEHITVAHWVRVKCMFGCPKYGNRVACPPATPPVDECRAFFNEYAEGIMLHFTREPAEQPERTVWYNEVNMKLYRLEQKLICDGYHKAFVFFIHSCALCKECKTSAMFCMNRRKARPEPEAFAVDICTTARNCGFPEACLPCTGKMLNRYSLLMLR